VNAGADAVDVIALDGDVARVDDVDTDAVIRRALMVNPPM
jgi:hypothetical protein